MDFVLEVIRQHEESELYKTAELADEYDRQENRTILRYQKFLRNDLGQLIPDNYSPNYKLASNYFSRFITQDGAHQRNQGCAHGGYGGAERRTDGQLPCRAGYGNQAEEALACHAGRADASQSQNA